MNANVQAEHNAVAESKAVATAREQLPAKQQRIAYYLASGVKPAQVASICAVTPAYISQLISSMKEDASKGQSSLLALAIAEYQAEAAGENKEKEHLANRYLAIEHTVLNAIESTVGSGTLGEQVRALQTLADIQDKRLKASAPPASTPGGVQVSITNITIPAHAISIPQVQMDSSNRIMAINQQPMAALNGEQVKNLFSAMKNKEQSAIAVSVNNAILANEVAGSGTVIDGTVSKLPEDF